MTKPMGSERSVILFLLNFLLLWQLGTGTTSTTIDDRIKEVVCNGTYILPEYEVRALQLLSQNLQSSSTQLSLSSSTQLSPSSSTQLSLSFPICSDNQDAEIRCGSPDNTKNGSFRSVTGINLQGKKLDGSIHNSIGRFKNLERLNLDNNQLSGGIPSTLGQLQHLKYLDLSSNSLTGSIPPSLTMLQTLWVSDVNNPGISFPEEVIPVPKYLSSVILRNCNINGPIPDYIGKWPQLSYLDLSFNNLNGSIPETFQNLTKLFLTRNMLTGELPSWITNNPNKSTVDLSYNNFNVSCKNIKCLGLQNVTIHPTRSFIDEMKSKKCRRKHNSLFINSGGEDVYYGKDHYHNDTSISSFNLSPSDDWAYSYAGEYLTTNFNASASVINSTCEFTSSKANIDNNFRLAPVSLTYYGLCLRKGEYMVTLYFAEALYSKSEDYSTSGKRVFDIYIQGTNVRPDVNIKEIYGKEHEGKQLNFSVKINDGSLEIQLFWAGKGSLYGPGRNGPLISAVSITRVPRKLHGWEIALIIGCCILFLLLLLAFMWRMGWIGDRELRETKVKIGERTFTLKQIIHATKKFSPKMQLGSGRSGIVYRAELPYLTVAVKKLFTHSKAVDEIGSEVYARKALDLKHENLVNLIASYSRRHLILLIYEYMEHGSLGQVLFGTNPTVQIDWQKRFIICRGIAKGLKYLHERNPPIIHRNIKANNILLDASCNPKISDFGLAKLYEEENPYIAIGAGGDLLYMSPEYATRRAMTVKVDVYSFGILLLEIVSGRNNADYRANQETVFLLDTAGNLNARGRLGDLVDPSLRTYDWDQAKIVLNLAMMCTDQSPSLRPTMSQVVAVLEGEKTLEDLSKEIAPST